ncbi:MAG: hypothetical protein H6639_22300 [Caldilineaceae bacterium]|nr:hypothetical protein [Caldilineaceae bacterium]
MRVNKWFVPVLAVALLLGTVGVAQATGWWIVSGKSMVDAQNMKSSADIKGWMSFQQVADGFGMETAALYAELGLPADLPPETALKEMEAIIPGFEVSTVREAIDAFLGNDGTSTDAAQRQVSQPDTAPAAAPEPTAAPTAEPSPTPAAVEHVPVGDGDGSGSGDGTGSGPAAPTTAVEIKGRHTLRQIAETTGINLDDLLAALDLPADTAVDTEVRSLVESGVIDEVDTIRSAVAELMEK